MNKTGRLLFVCVLILICFSSCSRGKLLILEANFLGSRGRYDDAIAVYLRALEFTEAAPYAEFGLGALFYLLGEDYAAIERFENSQKLLENLPAAEHRELRFRNSYNHGIVLFGQGNFQAAANAFRNALRADPRRIEAKRNLELSLLSLERQGPDEGGEEDIEQGSEARAVLFEFLRQREQDQWRSAEWTGDDDYTGPDY